MLDVVWVWQIKQEVSPFHEFFVIETVDPQHGNKIRRFILERVIHPDTEVASGNEKPSACYDRFLGEAFVDNRFGQCVRQLKPQGLKFFQLILLAHVVHMEAPTYTRLKNNCSWYVTTIFNAIVAHWGIDTSTAHEDAGRQSRYLVDPKAPGHWNGLNITTSNVEEISVIVSKYKDAYTQKYSNIVKWTRLLAAAQEYRKYYTQS